MKIEKYRIENGTPKLRDDYMKDQISSILGRCCEQGKFRTFAKAFRKHIDEFFHSDYTGYNNMDFNEWASYHIGDGAYQIEPEQFEAFIADIETKIK